MKDSSKIHINLLGFPQIQYQHEKLEIGTLKSQALLIYLVVSAICNPEQKIPREKLTDLLWPGMPLPSALQNLRQALYQIRKALPEIQPNHHQVKEWIIADRKTLVIDPKAPIDVDIKALIHKTQDPVLLKNFSMNGQNQFLDNFYVPDSEGFDDWITEMRNLLKKNYLNALERLSQDSLQQEQWNQALAYTDLLIKTEPLKEQYYFWQMNALKEAKRPNEAIRVYQNLVNILAHELGSTPSDKLQNAYLELKNNSSIQASNTNQNINFLSKNKTLFSFNKVFLGFGLVVLVGISFFIWNLIQHKYLSNTANIEKSIAVLPLENSIGQEYVAAGLTDGIIEHLTRIPNLKVISYISSSQYKGKNLDLKEIAQELGVEFLVTGQIYKINQKINISVHLIQASTGVYYWSKTFERPENELSFFQQEIARRVGEQFTQEKTMTTSQQQSAPTTNQEAYDWYLKGRYSFYQVHPDSLRKAMKYYYTALTIDPDFTLARTHLGWTICTLAGTWGDQTIDEVYPESVMHLEAIKKDPAYLSTYHKIRGWLNFWALDTENAIKEVQKAVALNPNEEFGYSGLSVWLTISERFDEAKQMGVKAIELNPHFFWNQFVMAHANFFEGNFTEAERYAAQAVQMNPRHLSSQGVLARSYAAQGKFEQAINQLASIKVNNPYLQGQLGIVYFHAGKLDQMKKILQQLEDEHQQGGRRQAYYIALLYNMLGEKNKALDWLEASIKDKESQLNWLGIDHEFRSLHGDARFESILNTMSQRVLKELK